MQERIKALREKIDQASLELTRQSGYVEGILETLISVIMDSNPEISIASDRLIKTFHSIEGIISLGFKDPLVELLSICSDLDQDNKFLQKENSDLSAKLSKKEKK